jgi:hypothetical protein
VEVQLGWRAINAFPLNPSTAIAVFVVKVYENKIQTQNKEKGKGLASEGFKQVLRKERPAYMKLILDYAPS